jgi:D-glycero-D-manno-heptose 1,7-bisphosphate phosphatase
MDKIKVAFLDRDGVINQDLNYVFKPEDFHVLPGVREGLKILISLGFKLIIITNQAGIGRGYYSEVEFENLCEYMRNLFVVDNINFEHIYYCPHHPDEGIGEYKTLCTCRKPLPGMLLQAAKDYKIDFSNSILIGDKISDIQAGLALNIGKTILVKSCNSNDYINNIIADYVCEDLLEAAHLISSV